MTSWRFHLQMLLLSSEKAHRFSMLALKQPLILLHFVGFFACQSQTYLKEIFHEIDPYYNRKMQGLASVNSSSVQKHYCFPQVVEQI